MPVQKQSHLVCHACLARNANVTCDFMSTTTTASWLDPIGYRETEAEKHILHLNLLALSNCDSYAHSTALLLCYDDAFKNAKLVSPSINCDWFTCRHLRGL